MNNYRQRIVRRRIGSVACGLLGLCIAVSAFSAHIEGLRTRHIEYMQNIPIFVIISAVLLVIGSALLFAAWRLWRMPERLP